MSGASERTARGQRSCPMNARSEGSLRFDGKLLSMFTRFFPPAGKLMRDSRQLTHCDLTGRSTVLSPVTASLPTRRPSTIVPR